MKRRLNFEGLEDRWLMTGATQLSGVGFPVAEEAEVCNVNDAPPSPEGTITVLALTMTGSLKGCLYSYVLEAKTLPSGTYREKGIDIYVGSGEEGDNGTFATTYLFTAKFDEDGNEVRGRCQHPITAGTGTGDFEGVSGRVDFKDNVDDLEFPYRGHLLFVEPD
jgi:hypothetical protein